jgi:hypothetical protein
LNWLQSTEAQIELKLSIIWMTENTADLM